MATLDHEVLGQEPRQRPHRGRLAGPFFTTDENAADRGHNRVEDEGELHRLLPDDGGEGKDVTIERDAHELRIGTAPREAAADRAIRALLVGPTANRGAFVPFLAASSEAWSAGRVLSSSLAGEVARRAGGGDQLGTNC